ncbi:concanavalin A-like lectin/glucanase superfamily protein [Nonomuraea polychroma]|uniref:Concanavalin A-like lectin/glucanase superfamily protein n=1 Tax=Nonomuraea polychroma TaxID=46176 RepID=A0A438MIS0_9ACTN|nr:LamG domain-containing protein [Nonomuraea polychroma]RVX45800.1 concanavalin A-like lectin/glucanase superfamily protein [Nonomuraea polychroma]
MSLVLHWPLHTVSPEKRVLDSSPARLHGTIYGDEPATVLDPRFGSCLEFNGTTGTPTYVLLERTPALGFAAYTVEAWVKPLPRSGTDAVGLLTADNLHVLVNSDGSIEHRFAPLSNDESEHTSAAGVLPAGAWRHVAVTYQDKVARIYLDGTLSAEYTARADRAPAESSLMLATYRNRFFPGRIAHFRIYNSELSEVEIKRDMAEDEAALQAYVGTRPLEFEFVNTDEQPVLYVEHATAGQTMTLRLTNTSRHGIEAMPTQGEHLTLRFRRGTLAAGLRPALDKPGWTMTADPDTGELRLRWPESTPLASGASLELPIAGLRAGGGQGAHLTRIELAYRKLKYTGESDELTGSRTRHLEILRHPGRDEVPLDLRIAGGDRVLSDGATPATLRLNLANALGAGGDLQLGGASFTVGFVVQNDGESQPWALTSAASAPQATLKVAAPGWTVGDGSLRDGRMRWTITPAQGTVLLSGGSVELVLQNVLGLPVLGHAQVTVEYEHVPGYVNGALTARVERSPLLFTAHTAQLTGLRVGAIRDAATWDHALATVSRDGYHMQLRRDTGSGGGSIVFLELFQDRTEGDELTFPNIRFHHTEKFWHRIEARKTGFFLKDGNETQDVLVDLHAATAVLTGLQIGGVTIGEKELQALKRLAADG